MGLPEENTSRTGMNPDKGPTMAPGWAWQPEELIEGSCEQQERGGSGQGFWESWRIACGARLRCSLLEVLAAAGPRVVVSPAQFRTGDGQLKLSNGLQNG